MVRVIEKDNRLYIVAPFIMKNAIKDQLEGRKWDPKLKLWHCRNCSRNWYVINQVWKKTEQFMRYHTPVKTQTIMKRWEGVLWPHQRLAADHLIHLRRMIYAADMGLGKTLTAFAAIDSLIMHKQLGKVWWVAGKSALKAFEVEQRKWKPAFTPEVVINYESLHKAIAEADTPPQLVVFDESTALKNIKAMRTQQALGLVELMEKHYGNDCYVWLFTGTPSPLDHLDWYAQCEVARPGFLKEGDWYRFRDRMAILADKEFNGNAIKQVIGWKEDEVKFLPKRMANLVLRHEKGKDDVVELPDKVYSIIQIPPSPSILRAARTIANTAETKVGALIKLRQLSDGFQYRDGKPVFVGSPKEKILVDLLAKAQRRIIIYAAFRASVDQIVGLCRNHGWSVIRADGRGWKAFGSCNPDLEDFQGENPNPIAFVGNPGAAGKGITLTSSSTIIFYSNGFKAEDRWQAEDRIHRAGSTGAYIIDLIHLPSDQVVLDNLRAKKGQQEETLDRIRGLYEAVHVLQGEAS